MDIEENVSDDDIENYDNLFENYFDHKCMVFFSDYRSRNFVTSKMEVLITIDKGYILDMARFLGLSLYYVKMAFMGFVLCKKNFIIGSVFVKYYSIKSFF